MEFSSLLFVHTMNFAQLSRRHIIMMFVVYLTKRVTYLNATYNEHGTVKYKSQRDFVLTGTDDDAIDIICCIQLKMLLKLKKRLKNRFAFVFFSMEH